MGLFSELEAKISGRSDPVKSPFVGASECPYGDGEKGKGIAPESADPADPNPIQPSLKAHQSYADQIACPKIPPGTVCSRYDAEHRLCDHPRLNYLRGSAAVNVDRLKACPIVDTSDPEPRPSNVIDLFAFKQQRTASAMPAGYYTMNPSIEGYYKGVLLQDRVEKEDEAPTEPEPVPIPVKPKWCKGKGCSAYVVDIVRCNATEVNGKPFSEMDGCPYNHVWE
ncbi:MAG: hypothetical protein V2B18_16500 [Pseudomonadota bacterium]